MIEPYKYKATNDRVIIIFSIGPNGGLIMETEDGSKEFIFAESRTLTIKKVANLFMEIANFVEGQTQP